MDNHFHLIASRSLEFLRRNNIPNSIDFHQWLDSLDSIKDIDWSESLLAFDPSLKSNWHHKKIANPNSVFTNDLYMPDPITLFSENNVLWHISKSKMFLSSSFVYSLQWAERLREINIYKDSNKAQEERNQEITNLMQSSDDIVITAEIQSVNGHWHKDEILKPFLKTLDACDQTQIYNEIIEYVEYFKNLQEDRFIENSEFSNFLLEYSLKNFDDDLSKEFSGKVLRYCNTINVVCKKEDSEKVLEQLNRLLSRFDIPIKFAEEISKEKWLACEKYMHAPFLEEFKEYFHTFIVFLIKYPKNYEKIRAKYQKLGFNLPFQKAKGAIDYRDKKEFFTNMRLCSENKSRKFKTISSEIEDELLLMAFDLRKKSCLVVKEISSLKKSGSKFISNQLNNNFEKIILAYLYLTPIDKLETFEFNSEASSVIFDLCIVMKTLKEESFEISKDNRFKSIELLCEFWLENKFAYLSLDLCDVENEKLLESFKIFQLIKCPSGDVEWRDKQFRLMSKRICLEDCSAIMNPFSLL